MPSRFEPCGLNQMYGLRYGTPPLVNRTGGLADSVIDSNQESIASKQANGFVMHRAEPDELKMCITRALSYYAQEKLWQQIQRQGMSQELGWELSAKRYLDLYEEMLKPQKRESKEVSSKVGTVSAN